MRVTDSVCGDECGACGGEARVGWGGGDGSCAARAGHTMVAVVAEDGGETRRCAPARDALLCPADPGAGACGRVAGEERGRGGEAPAGPGCGPSRASPSHCDAASTTLHGARRSSGERGRNARRPLCSRAVGASQRIHSEGPAARPYCIRWCTRWCRRAFSSSRPRLSFTSCALASARALSLASKASRSRSSRSSSSRFAASILERAASRTAEMAESKSRRCMAGSGAGEAGQKLDGIGFSSVVQS